MSANDKPFISNPLTSFHRQVSTTPLKKQVKDLRVAMGTRSWRYRSFKPEAKTDLPLYVSDMMPDG
jgi:hypothetical protein